MTHEPRRIVLGAIAVCAGLLLAAVARAADPVAALVAVLPPEARETGRSLEPAGSFALPIGPAGPATPPPMRQQDGARHRIAWTWAGNDADHTTAAMTGALIDAGFETLYTCRTDACGGFDFRLALPVLPLPDMAVNLADFRYAIGTRATPPALAALLVSATQDRTQVQLTLVLPAPATPPDDAPVAAQPRPEDAPQRPDGGDLVTRLEIDGRAVLTGLAFAPGGTTLETDGTDALSELAAWLAADPARRVALVGHTDWTGTPDANLAVSRARAAAVGAALEALGTNPARITVAGAGPFAPRASNATAAGRAANRRVEAVRLPPAP